MSDWIRHAVWWHVYPLGFTGAEQAALPDGAPPVPRLHQVEAWLPHLVGLGCNGLALGPVFESGTHGYDTVDHFRVDRRLGTEQDLQRLLDACAERGIRVMLDGVFNHVGRGFPRFQEVLRDGPSSPAAAWFHVNQDDGALDGFTYANFEGHDALVTLNHGNPEVAEYVERVMTHWCDRGVSAWRLDAAYAVPAPFWQRVLPQVRQRNPGLWVLGEVLHGDYPGYVSASGVDSVTQYELWKAVWSSFNDRNLFELAHALRRHGEMVRSFLPYTFLGNHDVTRLASRLTDERHLPLAVALLCTLPGVPSVYYGDEWALRGVKEDRAGGDDAVRPAFPPSPADALSGALSVAGVGVGAGASARASMSLHQELIGLRRRHPWLVDATVQEPDVLTNELLAVRLTGPDAQWLALLLNVGDRPAGARIPLPGGEGPGGEVLAGHGELRASDGHLWARVDAHAYLVVRPGGAAPPGSPPPA